MAAAANRRRADDAPPWWLIAGLAVFGGAAGAAWLRANAEQRRVFQCYNCERVVPRNVPSCPHCGAALDWAGI